MAGIELHAWETGRMNSITYVGLDVHKATVSVAVAESGRGGEIRQLGVFENRPEVLSKLAARLSNKNCRVSFCYEAGPCGYGLHRLLTSYGHDCVVVAPSRLWHLLRQAPQRAPRQEPPHRRHSRSLAPRSSLTSGLASICTRS